MILNPATRSSESCSGGTIDSTMRLQHATDARTGTINDSSSFISSSRGSSSSSTSSSCNNNNRAAGWAACKLTTSWSGTTSTGRAATCSRSLQQQQLLHMPQTIPVNSIAWLYQGGQLQPKAAFTKVKHQNTTSICDILIYTMRGCGFDSAQIYACSPFKRPSARSTAFRIIQHRHELFTA